MKVIIQRVLEASVSIENKTAAEIQKGLLIFLGITHKDTQDDIDWLCNKICNLRIFSDDSNVMNISVKDTSGDILLVSQFTLYANTKKGNRPSYKAAAHPNLAIPLYNAFINQLQDILGKPIQTGTFGAAMKVSLVNDGPITIIMDTHKNV